MRLLKSHVVLRLVNSYLVDSPQPANISYLWNFGSLLGACLVLQILTGVFLAMHYQPHVDFAFSSVEHIMRDVNIGWALRYCHANIASFFFIFVYAHIGRGLYYSSYREPRSLVWYIGVIILIVMMATAFLGYVLPYGQMSLWGKVYCPICNSNLWVNNLNFIISFSIPIKPIISQCQSIKLKLKNNKDLELLPFNTSKIRCLKRIGPHNYEILSLIFGSLLGDGYAEKHGKGTRICFQQEGSHTSYLLWFHNYLSNLGYCNKNIPKISSRLAPHGKLRKILRFKTFTYSSFNWIEEEFYKYDPDLNRRIKILPSRIENFLSPLALAIWIMDDGSKVSGGIKLSTNNFTKEEVLFLCEILINKFGLKATIQSAGVKPNPLFSLEENVKKNQYIIYISKTSMIKLFEIIKTYIHPSMKYKLNDYL